MSWGTEAKQRGPGRKRVRPGAAPANRQRVVPMAVSLLFLQLRNRVYLEMSDSGCMDIEISAMVEDVPQVCLHGTREMERCSIRSGLRRSMVGQSPKPSRRKLCRCSDAMRRALAKLQYLAERSRRCFGACKPLWCNTLGHVRISGLFSSNFLPQEL